MPGLGSSDGCALGLLYSKPLKALALCQKGQAKYFKIGYLECSYLPTRLECARNLQFLQECFWHFDLTALGLYAFLYCSRNDRFLAVCEWIHRKRRKSRS